MIREFKAIREALEPSASIAAIRLGVEALDRLEKDCAVVPKIPTLHMCDAGTTQMEVGGEIGAQMASAVYRAMIAAAQDKE